MKTFGIWLLAVGIAVILSTLSMKIQTGIDTSESETIGVQSKYGFPIHFQTTASGLAWAQYDLVRFGINTVVWSLFVGATATGWRRMKKRGANKASQAIDAPSAPQPER